jgi:hypothetical protein
MRHARHRYTPKEVYFRMVHLAARLAEYIDAQATAPLSDPIKIYVLYVYTRIYDFQAYILPGLRMTDWACSMTTRRSQKC